MGRVVYAYRTHPAHGRVLSQELVAGWLNLTQAQLSRIEHSRRPPDELSKLMHWAHVLRVPPDLLWFKTTKDQPTPPPPAVASLGSRRVVSGHGGGFERERSSIVQRRNFLGVGIAVAAADILTSLGPSQTPLQVRAQDVEQVQHAASMFTSWDHTYGGGMVRDAVIAQLNWAARLLNTPCPPSLRDDLLTAVGALAGVCGFMAFDAYAHQDATTMFTFGLSCAEETGAWHLRAKLLSHLARQAIWCGDPDTGLTHAELALVRADDRLTGTERAMLHTARARALAKLGRTQDTLRAVGLADDAFAQANSSQDPVWMAYYDHAQHYGDTGHALFDLAITGSRPPLQAAQRLATAVREHANTYTRSRAISGTKLATLTMATGDPQQASDIAGRALTDAGQLRSRRAQTDLRELYDTATPHVDVPDVDELRDRIRPLIRHTP